MKIIFETIWKAVYHTTSLVVIFSSVFILMIFGIIIDSEEEDPNKVFADLVITDGRIWTGNSYQPWARAMAIVNDTIAAIGEVDEIDEMINSDTQVVKVTGHTIIPGFIDAHIHFLELGQTLTSVQLRDAKTPEEFAERIKNYASTIKSGEWVLGGTWDHENWGGELPRKEWIDEAIPDNPVWVGRLDGHMGLANSLALQLAGVTSETEDIEGGEIVRDNRGNPTGILKDNAMSLMSTVIPEKSVYDKLDDLKTAMDHVAAQGVTSVIHVDGDLDVFREARRRYLLKTRIYAATPLPEWRELKQLVDSVGYGDKWLKWGALKGFVDGSLGSHTAAFFEPFTDAPDDRGIFLTPADSLYRWISDADEAGLQMMVHAIGDSAINTLLNIYEKVSIENGPRDRRFKMEHAQHLHPNDIARFSELHVMASMQPYHAIDDGRWAERVIGQQRIKTTYAFKSLLDAGTSIAFGSDAPVAPPTPLEGIYAAITRKTLDGANPRGWVPLQRITIEEALHAYTAVGAYASYDEKIKGTLEIGKLADFVILDADMTSVRPENIRDVNVLMTFVGGNRVYHREE